MSGRLISYVDMETCDFIFLQSKSEDRRVQFVGKMKYKRKHSIECGKLNPKLYYNNELLTRLFFLSLLQIQFSFNNNTHDIKLILLTILKDFTEIIGRAKFLKVGIRDIQ